MDDQSLSLIVILTKTRPMLFGLITLIIILAKMHGDINVLKEKVKSLFDLWNTKNK